MPYPDMGASRAPRHSIPGVSRGFMQRRVHAAFMAVLLAVALVPVQPPPTVQAASEASAVVAHAKAHLGARWVWGATGPSTFDCVGLVYHSFKAVGLASRIGGWQNSAGYYSYFRSRGRASRYNPRVGDLVVWGYSGYPSHTGIYIGNGYSISALTSGVQIHKTFAVTKPFIAYLHVSLSR